MRAQVKHGDIVVVATDGLFDNVFDEEIAAICGAVLSESGFGDSGKFACDGGKTVGDSAGCSGNGSGNSVFWSSSSETTSTNTSDRSNGSNGSGDKRNGSGSAAAAAAPAMTREAAAARMAKVLADTAHR
jgi:hypothetical protein